MKIQVGFLIKQFPVIEIHAGVIKVVMNNIVSILDFYFSKCGVLKFGVFVFFEAFRVSYVRLAHFITPRVLPRWLR